MKSKLLVLLLLAILALSSCSVLKNRGTIVTDKDVKLERNTLEFKYAFFEANKQKMLGNFNEAGAYLIKCIELFPDDAAANYELAGILAMAKDWSAADRYAKKAYLIDENNKWYQSLYISILKANGEVKKASLLLENMLTKHPDDYNSYIELTDIYLKLNQSKQALETLDKFEKKYGFTEALMVEKNRIHLSKKDYKSARSEIQKMINIEPDNSDYYLLLADLYAKEGRLDESFKIYQEVLKRDPENGRVHFSLSDYYYQKGEELKAFDELTLALASDQVGLDLKIKLLFSYIQIENPTLKEKKQVYQLVRILLKKHPEDMKVRTLFSDILVKDKKYKEAREELLIVTEQAPDNYAVWEQLLYIDNQLADFNSLYEHSVRMIDYFPNRAIAYFFSGLGAYQIKEYKEALKYAEGGLDFALNDTVLLTQFYTIIGDSYHKLNNHKKSDEAYENTISLDSKNYYVFNNYSYYLSLRSENMSRAKELMKKCIAAHPNNSTYLDTYAWVLYMDKDYPNALKVIKRAYENGGRASDVIIEHYGDILFVNNKKEEAVQKWTEALSKGKGSGLLEQKISKKNLILE